MVRLQPEGGAFVWQVDGLGQLSDYDGSWTCLTKSGKEKGPCSIAELCALLLE